MCAIIGFTTKSRSREEVQTYLDRTRSRGPDMARILETPLRHPRLPPAGHHGAGRERDAALCPGKGHGGVQRRALRLAAASGGPGGQGLRLPQRQRLRAPAPSVPGVRHGDVPAAGRGVRSHPLRRGDRRIHRRPGSHRHPPPVLRLRRRRGHRLCQRGQKPGGPVPLHPPLPAGALLAPGAVHSVRRPRPGGAVLHRRPGGGLPEHPLQAHRRGGQAAGRRRPPGLSPVRRPGTPAWCAPSPPGGWENPSAPSPSAWTPTPST